MGRLGTPRLLLFVAAAYLTTLALAAGAILAAVDDVAFIDGLWMAFSVVSTTGFGAGPATSAGMLTSMGLFVAAVPGYVAMLVAATMLAREIQGRLGTPHRPVLVERDVHRVLHDLNRN